MNPNSGLPRSLQWTPKDLEKVTVPQAVERVAKINEWRMKQKAEANEALARNPATVDFKTYDTVPGTDEVNKRGLAWKEIKAPKDGLPVDDGFGNLSAPGYLELEQALKYEGELMGHCVGGYCDDVISGNTKIYSLRDAKGEPHVTIETKRGRPWNERSGIFYDYPDLEDSWATYSREVNRAAREAGVERDPNYIIGYPDWLKANAPDVFEKHAQIFAPPPDEIIQIKGKGNRKPDDKYLPFVQDFVKNGNWSRVGDIDNTGLQKVTEGSGIPGFEEWMRVKAQGNVPTIPPGYYTPQELLQFGESSGLKQTHPGVYATWRKKLGLDSGEGQKAGGFIKKHKVGEKV